MSMPDNQPANLILHFDLHLLTNKEGVPINSSGRPEKDPDNYEYVPVLKRAEDIGEPHGKAFCGPDGWCDPDDGGKLYTVRLTPPDPDHWGQFVRNDILECDRCVPVHEPPRRKR